MVSTELTATCPIYEFDVVNAADNLPLSDPSFTLNSDELKVEIYDVEKRGRYDLRLIVKYSGAAYTNKAYHPIIVFMHACTDFAFRFDTTIADIEY